MGDFYVDFINVIMADIQLYPSPTSKQPAALTPVIGRDPIKQGCLQPWGWGHVWVRVDLSVTLARGRPLPPPPPSPADWCTCGPRDVHTSTLRTRDDTSRGPTQFGQYVPDIIGILPYSSPSDCYGNVK